MGLWSVNSKGNKHNNYDIIIINYYCFRNYEIFDNLQNINIIIFITKSLDYNNYNYTKLLAHLNINWHHPTGSVYWWGGDPDTANNGFPAAHRLQ